MIEVEKKFQPNEEQKKELTQGALKLGEERNNDVYYDYQDFRLFKKGVKLRFRNEKLELKIKTGEGVSKEIFSEKEIKEYLGTELDLKEFIEKNLVILANFMTEREKYLKRGFNIDIDKIDFGDGNEYRLCEIELLLEDGNSSEEEKKAVEKILEFAEDHGMTFKKLPSKLEEYLKVKKPELCKELFPSKIQSEIKMK